MGSIQPEARRALPSRVGGADRADRSQPLRVPGSKGESTRRRASLPCRGGQHEASRPSSASPGRRAPPPSSRPSGTSSPRTRAPGPSRPWPAASPTPAGPRCVGAWKPRRGWPCWRRPTRPTDGGGRRGGVGAWPLDCAGQPEAAGSPKPSRYRIEAKTAIWRVLAWRLPTREVPCPSHL